VVNADGVANDADVAHDGDDASVLNADGDATDDVNTPAAGETSDTAATSTDSVNNETGDATATSAACYVDAVSAIVVVGTGSDATVACSTDDAAPASTASVASAADIATADSTTYDASTASVLTSTGYTITLGEIRGDTDAAAVSITDETGDGTAACSGSAAEDTITSCENDIITATADASEVCAVASAASAADDADVDADDGAGANLDEDDGNSTKEGPIL
jgi:hypothetical protein